MNAPAGEIVIFFRKEGFYPVQLSGTRPVREEVADHAALNPGTLHVESTTGERLWPEGEPQ